MNANDLLQNIGNHKKLDELYLHKGKGELTPTSIAHAPRDKSQDEKGFVTKVKQAVYYSKEDRAYDSPFVAKYSNVDVDIVNRLDDKQFAVLKEYATANHNGQDAQELIKRYPALEGLKTKSTNEQHIALMSMKDMRESLDIIGSISEGIDKHNKEREIGYLGYKASLERNPVKRDEYIKQAKDLQYEIGWKYMERLHPVNKLANDLTSVLMDMGKDATANPELVATSMVASAAADAAVGTAVGSVAGPAGSGILGSIGTVEGGIKGVTIGIAASYGKEVEKRSAGYEFLELMSMKDDNGDNVYDPNEAMWRAHLFGFTDAALETGGQLLTFGGGGVLLKGAKKLIPVPNFIGSARGVALKEFAKVSAKGTLTETATEELQVVNQMTQRKVLGRAPEENYSYSDLTNELKNNLKEVLPVTTSLGILSGVGHGTHIYWKKRQFDNLPTEQKEAIVNRYMNDKIGETIDAIAEDSKKSPIAKHAPAVYKEVMQIAGNKGGLSDVYINASEAIATEHGSATLQALVENNIVTEAEVKHSIEQKVPIKVPMGEFAQKAGGLDSEIRNSLKDFTQGSEEAMSNHAISQLVKELDETLKPIELDKKQKMQQRRDRFIERYMNEMTLEEKLIANEVVDMDRDSAIKSIEEQRNELLGDVWRTSQLARVLADVTESNHKKKIYENDIRFYENALEQAKVQAIEGVGSEMLRDVEGLQFAIEQVRNMDNVITKIKSIPRSEFVRASLSDGALGVYDKVISQLNRTHNPAVKENAEAYALIMANHADAYTQAMHSMGYEHFTPTEYLKRVDIKTGGRHVENKQRKTKKGKRNAWKQDRQTVKGTLVPFNDGSYVINLFETADASTFIHEMGHLFLEDLHSLATMKNATESIKADWNIVAKETGYIEGGSYKQNEKAHEDFARKFEAYVRNGESPNSLLRSVFDRFRRLLCNIYRSLESLGAEPSKSLKSVMDRMVSTEENINRWAEERQLTSAGYSEFLSAMPNHERAEVENKLNEIKDDVYAKIHKKFIDEFNGDNNKLWNKHKAVVEEQIKSDLAKEYDCYATHKAYEVLGDDAFIHSKFRDKAEMKEAEKQALGEYYNVVSRELNAAKEAFLASDITQEKVNEIATEWLNTHYGQAELIEAQANALREVANAEIVKLVDRYNELDTLDIESENFIEEAEAIVEKPIDKVRRRAKERLTKVKEQLKEDKANLKAKHKEEKETLKEKFKEDKEHLKEKHKEDKAKLIEKNNAKLEELKEKLKERIAMARQLRDVKMGSFNERVKEQRAKSGNVPISQVARYKAYDKNVIRVGKKVDKALAKGDINEAIQGRYEQFDAAAMARVSVETNKYLNKTLAEWRRVIKMISRSKNPKEINAHARYFVMEVLYNLGVSTKRGVEPIDGFNVQELISFLYPEVMLQDGDTGLDLDPLLESLLMQERGYGSLTVNEFVMVAETIKGLYTRGLNEFRCRHIKDEKGHAVSLSQAVEEIIENSPLREDTRDKLARKNARGTKGKAKNTLRDVTLEFAQASTVIERIDGNKQGKAFHMIYGTMARADKARLQAEVEMGSWLIKVLSDYSKDELHTIRNERKYTIGKVSNCTKEQLICMALNLGTKENRQRLEETVGIPAELIIHELEKVLDDRDMKLVQNVWWKFEEVFPERSRTEERIRGVPVKKVKGIDFTFNGETIVGLYYPIKYDAMLDLKSNERVTEEMITAQISSNSAWGANRSGVKERMATVKGKKLLLDLDVITGALSEAINHIHVLEPALEVRRLIGNNDFQTLVESTLGLETVKYLKEWCRDCYAPPMKESSLTTRVLGKLRRNSAFASIGFSTMVGLLNVTNIFPMAHTIGTKNTLEALSRYYFRNQKANDKFVMENSVIMRNRALTLDKDLKAALGVGSKGLDYIDNTGKALSKSVDKANRGINKMNEFAYWFISKTDLMLAKPLWLETYRQEALNARINDGEIDENIVHERALLKADMNVTKVFGNSSIVDQSRVQRRKSLIAEFMSFYTYSNAMFNLTLRGAYKVVDTGKYDQLFNNIFFTWFLVAAIETLLRDTVASYTSGDDTDTEELLKRIGARTISNGVQGIGILRDVVPAIVSHAMGERSFGNRSTGSLSLALFDAVEVASQKMFSDNASGYDKARALSQVVGRMVGYSDTIGNGIVGLGWLLANDTDKDFTQVLTSLVFNKRLNK